jgi:polyphenol oxidase
MLVNTIFVFMIIIIFEVIMKQELILKSSNNVDFFYSKGMSINNDIKHFFSTRIGGVSGEVYHSLNLGIYTSDQDKNLTANFNNIFEAAGMDNNKIIYLRQVHSDIFHMVDELNYNDIIGKEGDAIITASKGIAIGVFTADCVPILLGDENKKIIAAIHAGWRGTNLRIVHKVIKYMIDVLGASPHNIKAALGPCIQKCCFEVKKEVALEFKYSWKINEKWYVDLIMENIAQLAEMGIPMENIETGNLCTVCNSGLFFSYRRDNGSTGRLGAFIQMV